MESQAGVKSFVRNLSGPSEFLLVMLICLGWEIVSSGMAIYGQLIHARPNEIEFSPTYITWSVLRELLSLAALLWIGAVRGWSYETFGFRLSWKGTAAGLLLLGAALAASILNNFVSSSLFHSAAAIKITGASLPFALLHSIVNPVFEETLECGYYFHALRNLGKGTAVLASAIFVGFLHAYQGLNGAVGVVMIRIIFGLAYWRWKNLWPLILAHSILDFLALANL
jgi:uncharacterized protein